MEARLVVLVGKHKGRVIQLPRTQFVIGRDKSCHLRPASPEVSKFHCALARSGPALFVRDLKSTNGTWVNGKRIKGTVRLKDGDVLQVGPLKFLVQIYNTEEGPPETPKMDWLLREPTQEEEKVLDPSSDTTIISGLESSDEQKSESTGAVAGELLREQLERRSGKKS